VAKKKKATRAGASKRAKKRAAPRKSAARPSTRSGVHRGLSEPNRVDLKYLKKDIQDHIDRLQGLPQTDRVANALKILDQARAELRSGCAPTMVIP